ncbi:hypothetical protein GBA63_20940 [Rubrobacter tropicus]|uniref:Uncharacterized protein n=1 Tax=Rubrobacter tropicus TaxID=2653851 RepID=A0A6G8QEA6_9ACTN|nr:hypothetical protein [Rubrobacter tropicus]QIN84834.1 hypothetical protein GBA63_20940 [Rubrobacter tropicus]
MLHQGQEKAQVTNISRWKSERGWLLRDRDASVAGRSFDEDLALFERQVSEEADERAGRLAGLASGAALSA